jgi:hypothetical protein
LAVPVSARRSTARHALEQQALGERLADEIVGAHAQAHLVDFLVLR